MSNFNVDIINIIAKINDISFSINVDDTTTLREYKKLLCKSAHLIEKSFKIFYLTYECSSQYDNYSIKELFPNMKEVILNIEISEDIESTEDEIISIKLDITDYCEAHQGKYKNYYCVFCKKSICLNCINDFHKNHSIKEKIDYLAPSEIIINNIFKDDDKYKVNPEFSKYKEIMDFRSNIIKCFDTIYTNLKTMENKIIISLDAYILNLKQLEKNINVNVGELKKIYILYFKKLKNYLKANKILVNNRIFYLLSYKLEEMEEFKMEYFNRNLGIYNNFISLFNELNNNINMMINDINSKVLLYINSDIYSNLEANIDLNYIGKIKNETVESLLFDDIEKIQYNINKINQEKLFEFKSPSPSKNKNIKKNFFEKIFINTCLKDNISDSLYKKLFGNDCLINDTSNITDSIKTYTKKNDKYNEGDLLKPNEDYDSIFDFSKKSVFTDLLSDEIILDNKTENSN